MTKAEKVFHAMENLVVGGECTPCFSGQHKDCDGYWITKMKFCGCKKCWPEREDRVGERLNQ